MQDRVLPESVVDIDQPAKRGFRPRVSPAGELCLPNERHEMSIDIATTVREVAGKVRQVAERLSNPDDKDVLDQLAARLVEIAERLERDARD